MSQGSSATKNTKVHKSRTIQPQASRCRLMRPTTAHELEGRTFLSPMKPQRRRRKFSLFPISDEPRNTRNTRKFIQKNHFHLTPAQSVKQLGHKAHKNAQIRNQASPRSGRLIRPTTAHALRGARPAALLTPSAEGALQSLTEQWSHFGEEFNAEMPRRRGQERKRYWRRL